MNHQYEGFLNDIARLGDAMRHRNEMDNAIGWRDQEIDDLSTYLARAYALREAAMEQLRRYDPAHPLLVDQDVRERIAAAGNHAFWNHRDSEGRLNFNFAKEVGRTFKIPGRD